MSGVVNDVKNVKLVTANPSALGLFGLAMVTLVASSQKLGWTSEVSFVVPWALFLGGLGQLIAAIQDFKHNNVFGATAFAGYGLFWVSMGVAWMIRLGVFGENMAAVADPTQLGVAFVGYFIFSIIMTIATVELTKVLFVLLLLIDVLFFALALDSFGIGGGSLHTVAAWSEFFISIVGFYGCAAAALNDIFGKVFLPVGKPFGIFK
ncbi:MAG: acetate uptake transporter [Deferribacteraceae bacterium]|jgi:succinate-acetate transporter protein|nr:acetate uptake transporter [Deferribacteraceae bacterium]